ncbi:hypothetical protein ACWM35_01340 [Neobacillus sp. K501]
MSSNENMKRWKTEEIIRRLNVALHGFDISKLSVQEQRFVEEQAKRRLELQAAKERLQPKHEQKLSKAEELEERRLRTLWAKFEKVTNGRPVKELSNADLEKQSKILRSIVGRKGV